ncbi:hypothetical protein Ctob_011420, partial [Chrysochromulina tobinii]
MLRLLIVALPLVVALPAALDRHEANAVQFEVQTTLQFEPSQVQVTSWTASPDLFWNSPSPVFNPQRVRTWPCPSTTSRTAAMPTAIGGFPLLFPLVAVSLGMCAESATWTPFDRDKMPLCGSRQPFLGATSPSSGSFFCLDTSVFTSDNDSNENSDGSPSYAYGTDCVNRVVRTASPPPPPHSPAMVRMNICLIAAGSSCSDDGGGPSSEFAMCAYPPSPPAPSPRPP